MKQENWLPIKKIQFHQENCNWPTSYFIILHGICLFTKATVSENWYKRICMQIMRVCLNSQKFWFIFSYIFIFNKIIPNALEYVDFSKISNYSSKYHAWNSSANNTNKLSAISWIWDSYMIYYAKKMLKILLIWNEYNILWIMNDGICKNIKQARIEP